MGAFVDAVNPAGAPALFVSMATSPEVERARRSLSGLIDDPSLPLPPLDSLAVSVLIIRSIPGLGKYALMTVEESSTLIAVMLQRPRSDVVCKSTMSDVLRNMPDWRRSILGLLLRYLCRLAKFCQKTCAEELARSIAPVLFRPEKLRFSHGPYAITQASIECLAYLITYACMVYFMMYMNASRCRICGVMMLGVVFHVAGTMSSCSMHRCQTRR